MCTVAAGSWAAGVRVWEDMSLGRRPRRGCPPPEGVDVAYSLKFFGITANAVARLPE